jgi:hypothetical protein
VKRTYDDLSRLETETDGEGNVDYDVAIVQVIEANQCGFCAERQTNETQQRPNSRECQIDSVHSFFR